MASKRKKERDALKNPDQFVTFWSRAGEFMVARARLLLAFLIAVIASTALLQVSKAHFGKRSAEISRTAARVESIATAALLPDGADAKAPDFDDDLPHFKTDTERKNAAIKAADEFIAKNGKSALKDIVSVWKARFLTDLARHDDAIAVYQSLSGAALDENYRFVADEGLAHAYEAKGDRKKAIAAFATLADRAGTAGGFYRDRALFGKARLLQADGDRKGAKALYRELVDKSPTSALRDEINDRLAGLEDGATTDAPAPAVPAAVPPAAAPRAVPTTAGGSDAAKPAAAP